MITGLRNELENRLNCGLGLAFLRIIPVIISDHRLASSALQIAQLMRQAELQE
jgi:hypothetical protein